MHYTLASVEYTRGMTFLRDLFPEGKADSLNVCLFSTSGIHGSYNTIEDVENSDDEGDRFLTFLVLHPRVVAVRYGNCVPETPEDFAFLKTLRATSHAELSKIGMEEK